MAIYFIEGREMIRLHPREELLEDMQQPDVYRIVEVMHANGYEISQQDAFCVWERQSDDYSAGWLFLPENDDELVAIILSLTQQEEH